MKISRLINKVLLPVSFTCIALFNIKPIRAQQITFTKTYVEFGDNHAFEFAELSDSGFIIVGASRITGTLPEYSFAMRITKYGDTLWTKNYSANSGRVYGITSIDDTSCIIHGGFYQSGGSGITLAKINLNGDTIFRKEFGNSGSSGGIHKTYDGGYITNNVAASDYGFLKLDSSANEEWHTWENMQIGCAEIKPDINKGYIAVGGRYDNFTPYEIARLDSAGGIIWQYQYGNTISTMFIPVYAIDVVVMADSNYLVGTRGPDWQLMKIDRNTGDTLWTRNYDSSFYYSYVVYCMDYAGSDQYIIGTASYFMLINSNGDSIWKKSIPFTPYTAIYDVHKTSDGGYAFCGSYFNISLNYRAIIFVKLDSLGNTVFTSVFNPENNFQPLSIYPNPFIDNISITIQNQNPTQSTITIKNILGQTVFTEQPGIRTFKPGTSLDLGFLSKGIYFLEVVLKDGERMVGKIVKE